MKAMILAAGLGTRLRPYTERFAKPAIPFLGIPLLYYAVALLRDAGVTDLVLNASHLPEQIQDLSRRIPGFEGRVQVSVEPGAPLGSGGGIWKAKSFLLGGSSVGGVANQGAGHVSGHVSGAVSSNSDSFLIANGDEVIFPSRANAMKSFVQAHDESDSIATLFVMRHPEVGTKFGGVWADPEGFVHGFGKTSPDSSKPLTAYHYVGVQALRNAVFKFLPEGESNILYDALAAAIKAGHRVRIFEESCRWFETGNPTDFLEATRQCLTEDITDGQSFLHRVLGDYGAHLHIKGTVVSATSCYADLSAKLSGFVVIGENVRIGADVELENVVILPGSYVEAGAKFHNTIVML